MTHPYQQALNNKPKEKRAGGGSTPTPPVIVFGSFTAEQASRYQTGQPASTGTQASPSGPSAGPVADAPRRPENGGAAVRPGSVPGAVPAVPASSGRTPLPQEQKAEGPAKPAPRTWLSAATGGRQEPPTAAAALRAPVAGAVEAVEAVEAAPERRGKAGEGAGLPKVGPRAAWTGVATLAERGGEREQQGAAVAATSPAKEVLPVPTHGMPQPQAVAAAVAPPVAGTPLVAVSPSVAVNPPLPVTSPVAITSPVAVTPPIAATPPVTVTPSVTVTPPVATTLPVAAVPQAAATPPVAPAPTTAVAPPAAAPPPAAAAPPAPAPAPAAPRSWSSLLASSSASSSAAATSPPPRVRQERARPAAASSPARPPSTRAHEEAGSSASLQEWYSQQRWQPLLAPLEPSARPQPRGFLNPGNLCFANSVLQALLACPPFVQLLRLLVAKQQRLEPHSPVLQALAEVGVQVGLLGAGAAPAPAPPPPGAKAPGPVALSWLQLLQLFNPELAGGGRHARQEDAQEFLSFLLDRLHEELLVAVQGSLDTARASPGEEAPALGDDGEWETVGRRNRTAVTRVHALAESAVSLLFGGQLQSLVRRKGSKASATVQPFFLLQLDIARGSVYRVEDALRLFSAVESLESSQGARQPSDAVKDVKLHSLPHILALHLMRFSYSGERGAAKLHKPVAFPLSLNVPEEVLTSTAAGTEENLEYQLAATISHHGRDMGAGHYTTDARQSDGTWLRFDDGKVTPVSAKDVLEAQAYLLFYLRTNALPEQPL